MAGALAGGEYVERLFQAMAAEAADELAASEQHAAKRALRKAELKVRGVPSVTVWQGAACARPSSRCQRSKGRQARQ